MTLTMLESFRAARERSREKSAFSPRQRAQFYADMASFMDAGIPPFKALEQMAMTAERRKLKSLAVIYRRVLRRLNAGLDVAAALAPELPREEAAPLVSAAKAGNDVLESSFRETAKLLDRKAAVMRKLRGALVSSSGGLLAILAVIVMMMTVVVPQLEASLPPEAQQMMGFARYYFAFGHGFLAYGPAAGLLACALAAWAWWSLPRWYVARPYWRRDWCDSHLMPWTLYVRTQSTMFLSTLASMLRSGVPLREVLESMRPFATPWMRFHLRGMLRGLAAGRAEVHVLSASFLPRETADRLSVYALIPDLTAVLGRLADDNFLIYEKRIDLLAATLRTVTLVVLATFVVCTLFAIFDFTNVQKALSKA
jgi:type II secretory pathway component PulF